MKQTYKREPVWAVCFAMRSIWLLAVFLEVNLRQQLRTFFHGILASVGMAALGYRYFEAPILRLKM